MSQAPRLPCPVCGRSIAILLTAGRGGRYARHDPPERGPLLLSCHGSLQGVPLSLGPSGGPPTLFDDPADEQGDPDDDVVQDELF